MSEVQGARVSRDTRRLLATVLLSLAALWILARIRFPERPPTPNPVAPVLTQIAPRAAFEDLERAVFEMEPVVSPALVVLRAERRAPGGALREQPVASLRFRSDAVLALTDGAGASPAPGVSLAARDRASGLTVYRTPPSELSSPKTWTPQTLDYPRYVLVSDTLQDRVALRPVFVASLATLSSSAWGSEVWRFPASAEMPTGAFVFTTSGSLAGIVASSGGERVIVPAESLVSFAGRLLTNAPQAAGWLGVEVRAMSPSLRSATGLSAGVVVTWADPKGPAAGKLVPTDIVQGIGADPVTGPGDWDVHIARLAVGQSIVFRVRRGARNEDVQLVAAPAPVAPVSQNLGLTLRNRRGVGVEVLTVEEGSVAMRAGIRAGDVLTRAGDIDAPSAAQLRRALTAAGDGAVLVALTRGSEHFVAALGKQ